MYVIFKSTQKYRFYYLSVSNHSMNLLRFLFSKSFFKQLFYAALCSVFLFLVVYFGLNIITKHNDYQKVPELRGISLIKLSDILKKEGLRFEIIDSSRYIPSMRPLTVISHIPFAGKEVKKNRKIYLTVNPSGYRKITLPNIIQITKRNAVSLLKSVGFEVGECTYRDNIGKDMVLEVTHDGQIIEPGVLLPKTTIIDLVLGNGKR